MKKELPSLPLALLPVILTLGLLALQLFYYGDFTPHIPLAIGLAITALLGVLRGQTWLDIREGVFHVIHVSMPSLAVLIVVGMIIGTWIAAGTVPTLIYYPVRRGLAVLGDKLGHGRHGRSGADGHWRGVWHSGLLDRWRHRLGRILRGQDLAAVGHHQPCPGGDGDQCL